MLRCSIVFVSQLETSVLSVLPRLASALINVVLDSLGMLLLGQLI